MLRSRFILAGFAFTALGLSACDGSVESTGTGGSGGGTGGSTTSGSGATSDVGIQPPDPGPEAPGDGTDTVLAIRKLYLGDTDRDGNSSTSAWKEFGFDLDGKVSTKDSKDLCKPVAGAKPSAVYEDGTDGRDNSFGKNILPIITSLASDASTQVNDSIEGGSFTIMLKIDKLGTGDNYNPLMSKLYGGAKLVDANMMEIQPKWDGTDAWPVVPELLNGGNIEDPKVQFPKAYLVSSEGARTWVSGGYADITLNLSVGGFTLGLTISSAVITTDISADNTKASNGTIAGILDTEQLIAELAKVAGSFDPSLCPPSSTFESIAQQIRQASDILTDGGQDPAKDCDGISIGLGFDMQQVQLGAVAPAAEPQPNPCDM
ncbi:MAG: hypothetical protein IPK82_32345 [Polyangiaceae bacterium]|nr:hypothetical protein [Polyangiaceae bacterium]